ERETAIGGRAIGRHHLRTELGLDEERRKQQRQRRRHGGAQSGGAGQGPAAELRLPHARDLPGAGRRSVRPWLSATLAPPGSSRVESTSTLRHVFVASLPANV